jgi:hypothetical protein
VRTGRIAEMFEKIGAHGLGNFRVNWSSGIVIKVYRFQALTLQFTGFQVSGKRNKEAET